MGSKEGIPIKASRRILFFLEYGLVLGLYGFFLVLPRQVGPAIGRRFGRVVGWLAGSRSRLAEDNMRRAFPCEPLSRLRQWVGECWENLGAAAWEFASLSLFTADDYLDYVKVEGLEHVRNAFRQKKGVVFFTPHFTNWELTPHFVTLLCCPMAVIARRIKNPFVDAFINRTRSHLGVRVIYHREAVRESIRWLKQGKALGLLFDQRITEGGVKVDFFGRPAHTTSLPALLAIRLGSPLLPVHCWRDGGKICLRVDTPVDVSDIAPDQEGLVRLTARMTAIVEDWIRERPPMWLWIHNRWKE